MTRLKIHSPRSVIASLVLVVAVTLALLGVIAGSSGAAAGDTTLVYLGFETSTPSISSDARFVAFEYNGMHIKVHDRQTGTNESVDVSSSGAQANSYSFSTSISSDGRFIAFGSSASNLVENDNNSKQDIFVRDRQTGTTERVSVSSSGVQGNGQSQLPSISSNGRFVAFQSKASNLVARDTNQASDVFVHDRQTGTTKRISVSSSGVQGNDLSWDPSISSDGRFVAFESFATNLVEDNTDYWSGIFVHELDITAPKVVGVAPTGGETDVLRSVNAEATFSEPVQNVRTNFKLYRSGSRTPVDAAVAPVASTNNERWLLKPDKPLRAGTMYVAKIRTGIMDQSGNALDQNPDQGGNQSIVWTFKTGS